MRYVLGNFDKNGLGCILGDFFKFSTSGTLFQINEEKSLKREMEIDLRREIEELSRTCSEQQQLIHQVPESRGPFLTSPIGSNFEPRGEFCPPGVNFVPQG
jgi:hypothetical protein